MNIERTDINKDEEVGKLAIGMTNEGDLSKFITIRIQRGEIGKLLGIVEECKKIGLNVGVSTIVRKVYNEGLKTLNLDDAMSNPLSLFTGDMP